jgi:hypothetical protein
MSIFLLLSKKPATSILLMDIIVIYLLFLQVLRFQLKTIIKFNWLNDIHKNKFILF